jgi:MFS-type transporter involved in bile tolerance (Atg22 family)
MIQKIPVKYQKTISKWSWYIYDWANSVYVTSILATFLRK